MIYLVTESDGFFGQLRQPWEGLCLDEIERHLAPEFTLQRVSWMQLANAEKPLQNAIILHSSSQQSEYKAFIDDVLLYLEGAGNKLVPSLKTTRSHENKGFQELHKRLIGIPSLSATYFAKPKEVELERIQFPAVFKSLAGFGSGGVQLVKSAEEFQTAAIPKPRYSWTDLLRHWKQSLAHGVRKHLLKRKDLRPYGDYYDPIQRGVIQQLIPNLECDFKVLTFQNRIFIARRGVRPNDFRASGSGRITWGPLPDGLIAFASDTLQSFNEPYMSFDVAYDGSNFHLIEFQGVHFGPRFLFEAPTHFQRVDGNWEEKPNGISLEQAIGESLKTYLNTSQ
jgi:hypothetical protein